MLTWPLGMPACKLHWILALLSTGPSCMPRTLLLCMDPAPALHKLLLGRGCVAAPLASEGTVCLVMYLGQPFAAFAPMPTVALGMLWRHARP